MRMMRPPSFSIALHCAPCRAAPCPSLQPPGPQVLAVHDRCVPVDRRLEPWRLGRKRIGDDVRCRERAPGKCFRRSAKRFGLPDGIVLERASRGGKLDGENRVAFHGFSVGTSSHFFLCQLLSPSSASWTPRAPSSRFQRKAPSPATCLRNSSHCTLKALS